jgi:hypothetical protein
MTFHHYSDIFDTHGHAGGEGFRHWALERQADQGGRGGNEAIDQQPSRPRLKILAACDLASHQLWCRSSPISQPKHRLAKKRLKSEKAPKSEKA